MADFLLAAWLAWMTPLPAALSSLRLASRSRTSAWSLSPASAASRNFRIAVFTEDLTDLLRSRRRSFVLIRLIWDLILAIRRTPQCRSRKVVPHLCWPRFRPPAGWCGLPPWRNAARHDDQE